MKNKHRRKEVKTMHYKTLNIIQNSVSEKKDLCEIYIYKEK